MKKSTKIELAAGIGILVSAIVVANRLKNQEREYTSLPVLYKQGKHHVEKIYEEGKEPTEFEIALKGYRRKGLPIHDLDNDTVTVDYVNLVDVNVSDKKQFGKVARVR